MCRSSSFNLGAVALMMRKAMVALLHAVGRKFGYSVMREQKLAIGSDP